MWFLSTATPTRPRARQYRSEVRLYYPRKTNDYVYGCCRWQTKITEQVYQTPKQSLFLLRTRLNGTSLGSPSRQGGPSLLTTQDVFSHFVTYRNVFPSDLNILRDRLGGRAEWIWQNLHTSMIARVVSEADCRGHRVRHPQ